MATRRSSIHSDSESDDERLIISLRESDKHHEHIPLRTVDAPLPEDNADDNNNSDAEILLVEATIEPPKASAHIFTQAPARYTVASWAFFGFFCLYALRVNFSVAIVAMVRIFWTVWHSTSKMLSSRPHPPVIRINRENPVQHLQLGLRHLQ